MKSIEPKERAELAKKVGVDEQYLYQIFSNRRLASPALAVSIERETLGEITRQELRPDDWAQIWPELVQAPATMTFARDSEGTAV